MSIQFKSFLKAASKSVWTFPAVLFLVVILLTSLKISGTSIGVYSQIYGGSVGSEGEVIGGPRGVRSDEWLVTTQLTIAQAAAGYPRINENIGDGLDMSLIGDVPYKEWSSAFRPQNLAFLVLPLEYAFAFKWWFIGLLLIVASYFFTLELFPKKILLAVLAAAVIGLSPMMIWWYSSGMLLTIAYSLLIGLLLIRLLKSDSVRSRLIHSTFLAYTLVAFALILYPPFQIISAITIGVFLLGWWLEHYRASKRLGKLLTVLPYLGAVIASVIVVGFIFFQTHEKAINTIAHTAYPGARLEQSGGADPLQAVSSFLSPNLQYDNQAASGYLNNQSEASDFIFIAPWLLIPSLYVVVQVKRKSNKLLWGLILINALLALFLLRMYVHTPWFEPIYKLFLFDKIPSKRILLGVGFAGILQLLLLIKALRDLTLTKIQLWIMALLGGASALITMLLTGVYTINHYPQFVSSMPKVLVFSTWIALAIFALLKKRILVGLALLVVFSIISVYKVHPLYRGLSPYPITKTIEAIQSYPKDATWLVTDNRLLINFPLMAGRDSLSAVYLYPDLQLWAELDNQKQYKDIYNRYAHIVFSSDEDLDLPFKLLHTDTVLVDFEPCQNFFQTKADYVLADKLLFSSCIELSQVINLPNKALYVYEISD